MSLVFTGALLLACSRAVAAPLSADEVVRHALSHHPDPAAARAEIEIARAERRSVGLLSANPTLEAQLGAQFLYAQGVQPLSLTGEGWAARRSAALEADSAGSSARRTELVVAASAREAWALAAAAARQAALAEELLALAGRLRQTVEAREAVGEAAVLEVNLARVAEARAVAQMLELRAQAAERRQQLASFHPDALEAELGQPEEALPEASAPQQSERSDVVAARLETDAARAALRRERASAIPPVGVGAWVQGEGHHWTGGPYVEAEVPLFTFRQGPVAEARGRLAVAEAEQARVEQVARAEQQTTGELVEVAQQGLARIEGVEEAARDALVAIDQGFEAGELDLSTAVLLRTEVFDGWIASIDARAAAVQSGLASRLAREDQALLAGAP